jgi:D-sedoheptulose 7-phosphate isomerase
MQLNLYNKVYQDYFSSPEFKSCFDQALEMLGNVKRIFFIGNGGSNSICSHMYEDFAKIGGYQTFAFSDAALITCFANDYGYENAMKEWLKIYIEPGDLLVAISSSGKSANILNASDIAKAKGAQLITLSGFESENKLRAKGDINFYIECNSFGVVECFHQVILHALLDQKSYIDKKNRQ